MSKQARIVVFVGMFIGTTLFLTYCLLKWIGAGFQQIDKVDARGILVLAMYLGLCVAIPMLTGMGLRYILRSVRVGIVSMLGATLLFTCKNLFDNRLVTDYTVLLKATQPMPSELIMMQLTLGLLFGVGLSFIFTRWGVLLVDRIRDWMENTTAKSAEATLSTEPEIF